MIFMWHTLLLVSHDETRQISLDKLRFPGNGNSLEMSCSLDKCACTISREKKDKEYLLIKRM